MRKVFISLLVVFILLATTGCEKNPPSQKAEENILISTDAGALTYTPGPNFNFNLMVESAMPGAGVRITFDVKGETDNQVYRQGPAIETTNKTTRISITNLPRQKFCVCTITVTSKSKPTNTATTSFRVVYK